MNAKKPFFFLLENKMDCYEGSEHIYLSCKKTLNKIIEAEQRLTCLLVQMKVLQKNPVPEQSFRALLSSADLNCSWLLCLLFPLCSFVFKVTSRLCSFVVVVIKVIHSDGRKSVNCIKICRLK